MNDQMKRMAKTEMNQMPMPEHRGPMPEDRTDAKPPEEHKCIMPMPKSGTKEMTKKDVMSGY